MNMKKVTSVALAAALAASMAVSASAVSVGHAHDECSVWNWALANGDANNRIVPGNASSVFDVTLGYPEAITAATVAHYTRVDLPKGVKSTYTACKEAITEEEMDAICEGSGSMHALTVFKQRNLSNVTAGDEVSFRLWTVGKKNSVVVLFRAEGDTAWQVLGQSNAGVKDITVTLPGNGAYAVCMTW